jgi:transcriptional regulator with GAF, ATPase, and Fis domain
MNGAPQTSSLNRPLAVVVNEPPVVSSGSGNALDGPGDTESRIASLKILALTLLSQIESLEGQVAAGVVPELSLQTEVHHFEAALIRNALVKTGGRQRRAARLLGVKVTTLNTKIKRLRINVDPFGVR